MKKGILFIMLLGALLPAIAQTGAGKDAHAGHEHTKTTDTLQTTTDGIEFKETVYDFGTIPQGKPVYHIFEIMNKGTTPLKLENVQTTCGCTTPEWSKEPIAAGGKTSVKVGYNAASEGAFEKYITVQYNGSGSKSFKIKGIVWKAPVGAAPANAAVQFLKQQIQ